MPFVKGDGKINRSGRPKAADLVNPKSLTGSEVREKELKQLLRRYKPLVAKALANAEKVLDSEDASEQGKLRATALILAEYPKLLNEAYGKESNSLEEQDNEEKTNAPIISFKVLDKQG